MNEKPENHQYHPPVDPSVRPAAYGQTVQTVKRFEHAVRRCTSEDQAKKALDEAYANGYELLTSGCGGQDGQVMWYVFQRSREEVQQPAIEHHPPAPRGPTGGNF